MAYNQKEIYDKSLKLIKDKNLIFIEDIIMLLPISKPTFYDYFPPESNEFNAIKKLIDENKVNIKVKLRKQMAEADTSADRAMLYKLVGTDEECSRLNKSEVRHSGEIQRNGNDVPFNVNIINGTEKDS